MFAKSIDAPVIMLELGGEEMELRFDSTMIVRTELGYMTVTEVQLKYLHILALAERGMYSALLAMIYGAAYAADKEAGVDGRHRVRLEQLMDGVSYPEILDAQEAICHAAREALDAGRRGAEKHADAAGGTAMEPDAARGAGRRD